MDDPTQAGIISLALSHIGQKSVTSTNITNLDTKQAAEAMKVWDYVVKETLRAYDWNFARVVEALTEDDDYDPLSWEYAYDYPDECVAIRQVFPERSNESNISSKYEVLYDSDNGVKVICTDVEDAYIRYTFLVEDVALWDGYFITALARRLASELAMPLNGNDEQAKNQLAIFMNLISDAKRHNFSENNETHEANTKSDIVDARG